MEWFQADVQVLYASMAPDARTLYRASVLGEDQCLVTFVIFNRLRQDCVIAIVVNGAPLSPLSLNQSALVRMNARYRTTWPIAWTRWSNVLVAGRA